MGCHLILLPVHVPRLDVLHWKCQSLCICTSILSLLVWYIVPSLECILKVCHHVIPNFFYDWQRKALTLSCMRGAERWGSERGEKNPGEHTSNPVLYDPIEIHALFQCGFDKIEKSLIDSYLSSHTTKQVLKIQWLYICKVFFSRLQYACPVL